MLRFLTGRLRSVPIPPALEPPRIELKRPTPAEIYREWVESVALLQVTDWKWREIVGSGFVVGDGLILTAWHVVNCGLVNALFPARDGGEVSFDRRHYADPVKCVLEAAEPRADLALLRVLGSDVERKPIPLSPASAGPGDEVYVIGQGGKVAAWRFGGGHVRQAYRSKELRPDFELDAKVLESTIPTNGGDSGAPVFDGFGRVAAVHIAAEADTQQIKRHVDVSEVRAFLKANKVEVG